MRQDVRSDSLKAFFLINTLLPGSLKLPSLRLGKQQGRIRAMRPACWVASVLFGNLSIRLVFSAENREGTDSETEREREGRRQRDRAPELSTGRH